MDGQTCRLVSFVVYCSVVEGLTHKLLFTRTYPGLLYCCDLCISPGISWELVTCCLAQSEFGPSEQPSCRVLVTVYQMAMSSPYSLKSISLLLIFQWHEETTGFPSLSTLQKWSANPVQLKLLDISSCAFSTPVRQLRERIALKFPFCQF